MQVSELVTKATSNLHALGYTARTAQYFISTWEQFLRFCSAKGITDYTSSLCDDFLSPDQQQRTDGTVFTKGTLQRKTGIMKMLDTFYTQGDWMKGRAFQPQPLPTNFEAFLDQQDAVLVKKGYSECSRETVRDFSERFLRFLVSENINALEQLASTNVAEYLLHFKGHAKSTIRCELSRFRQMLKAMYLLQFTTTDLAVHIPSYNLGQSDSLIKIWESNELSQLTNVIDNSNPKGKRDLAYITFATELGMRSYDIRNLKLTDINWERCCITFAQSKTGKLNTLPLNEKLGTVIIDYLRVRPVTDSPYLFVNLTPPYDQMRRFNGMFQRYVQRAGIHVEPQAHHGLHSLRATVATRLLEKDVAADVIAPFLGHSDQASLKNYIRMDIENLRKCALSFEDGELI